MPPRSVSPQTVPASRGERIGLGALLVAAMAVPSFVAAKSLLPVPTHPAVPAVGSGSRCGRPFPSAAQNEGLVRGPVAFAQLPGDVASAADAAIVDGQPPEDHAGQISYVTGHVADVTNWLALDLAGRDCRADLLNRREVLGDADPATAATADARAMSSSQEIAAYVAFRYLGQKVDVSGAGVIVDSTCLDGTFSACKVEAPAAKVLRKGDIVTAVGGQPVQLTTDLATALAERKPGDTVTIAFTRDGAASSGDVTLVEGAGGRAILGILPSAVLPATARFSLPYSVEIDAGPIGGASAGLAWTLAIVDSVTDGDLFGGKHVVATGEIGATGAINNVGGVRQKALAAAAHGAEVMLVPAEQAATARIATRGTGLAVRGVETLTEALTALAEWGGGSKVVQPPTAG